MDITPIVKAAALLIGAIFIYLIRPYLKARTTAEQQQNINFWVRVAVQAAEQIYVGEGRGAEKKEFVLSWLADHDIEVDPSAIDAIIEAAVYELNEGLI